MDLKRWLRMNPDRAGAWACVALGIIVLVIGWEGASNTAYTAEQLPYIISGGIGGALFVAMGATLLISADLRDEWHKLDRIEKRLTPRGTTEATSAATEEAEEEVTERASTNGGARPRARRS